MMKRFLYLAAAILVPFFSMSQAFKFDTDEEKVEGTLALTSYGDVEVVIDNLTDESLYLGWEVTDRKENEGWDFSLCDLGNCHAGVPESGKMMECKVGAVAFLKLTANPQGNADVCHFTFKVYDVNNAEDFKEITLVANANVDGTTSITEATTSNIQIFPNPTADFITIQVAMEATNISLLDLEGKTIYSHQVTNVQNHQLDLSHLAKGMYVVAVQTEDQYHRIPVIRK